MDWKLLGIACHVGDEKQFQNLLEQTLKAYGGVDILVNNAATNPFYGPLDTMDHALFDKIMDINVKAPFLLANLCYPIMKKRGGGKYYQYCLCGGNETYSRIRIVQC